VVRHDNSYLDHFNLFRKAASRLLEQAKMSASRPRTVPSEVQHAKILQDLEKQQLSLGKATNETQDMLRDKEAQVVRMRAEERELELREEDENHDLDSAACVSVFPSRCCFALSD
jgi:kinetochore protein Spc24, fungi type